MQSHEIRQKFLDFFKKRGHAILESAPLVPLNDPSVLFNTAGMQPLVPYLMGEKHPQGSRLASCQKCVRTGDLEDIGDNRHFSFFEMLGNWSLGDYFKEEAITWSYEFLTSKEEGLGLDPNRLYVTIFEGDENAPYDQESKDIWMNLGIPEHRIYALGADDNWWSPGDNGPCGPCSEMFYDMVGTTGDLDKEGFLNATEKETVIEIWNDVFMEYEKKDGKVVGKLSQKNVDTGAGLERLTAVMQNKNTAYETDLFEKVMEYLKNQSVYSKHAAIGFIPKEKEIRVIADHIRTALFMLTDGVIPSNKDRGYILRRLIRRAMVRAKQNNLDKGNLLVVKMLFQEEYQKIYNSVSDNNSHELLKSEFEKFEKTLETGLKEFEQISNQYFWSIDNNPSEKISFIMGEDAFTLFTTYGFPIELTIELAKEKGMKVDEHTFKLFIEDFNKKMKEHQELSRTSSAGMFKGGLANTNEKTVQLHTTHHLLLAALQEVLGKEVKQRGSNITEERLRMDFSFDRKMTDEEKTHVEAIVNEHIQKDLLVKKLEMKREDAENIGAEMEFGAKYPDVVSVYVIEEKDGTYFSKEFCGGPHVEHTGILGTFKIQKEESVAQGVRRIKGVLI